MEAKAYTRHASFVTLLAQGYLVLLLTSYSFCNHEVRAYKEGDVMLGGLFNLHFAGSNDHCDELFTMGLGHAEAMIFAIESINENQSLLPNVTLGYDIRNYCESTALAMKITYDFMRESDTSCMCDWNVSSSAKGNATKNVNSKPISALVGPYNSGSAVLVGSLLQVADIPAISPTATSVELSSQLYKDFFRTVPPDNWQAKVMADLIELFNWTYVAAVGLDDSYGRNGIWALEKESYNRETFCVAFSEFIPRLGYQDKIKQTVAKIKLRPSIGVIIVWLSGGYGRAFFVEAINENIEDRTLILSDALTAEEAVFLDPRFKILDGSLGIQPRDYRDRAFEEHLKMITPAKSVETGLVWWDELWRSQFNCSATHSRGSGVAVCDANLTSYHAVTKIRSSFVSYLIDAVYALAHALNSIYLCPSIKGQCPSLQPAVKGNDLQKYLRNVSFNGLTGNVRFDSSSDPLSASYDIINFQRQSTTEIAHRKVLVGVWDKDANPKLKINTTSLRWSPLVNNLSGPVAFCASECLPGTMKAPSTPCCWDCITCPQGTISSEMGSKSCKECDAETKPNKERTMCEHLPTINIGITSATGISVIIVAIIGLFLTALVCAYYAKFYETPIVKASSREVSFLLLLGIAALFGLSSFELAIPSNLQCSIAAFWRYSALNLCITVLFVKTMRITSVFQVDKVAQLFTPCFKTVTRQTILISFMNVSALLLLALWMCVDPPGREKIIRSDEHIFLVCKLFYNKNGFSLFLTVCIYTLIIALLCTYYAFKARGIPENFNEAKYIGFSMYILLLSSLAYYPVAFAFESWYVTLVSCCTTLVISFGFLSCMFGPKVYILLFHPQQNTMESVRSQVSQYSFHVSRTKVWAKPVALGKTNSAFELSKPE